jgi:hypothetical protein
MPAPSAIAGYRTIIAVVIGVVLKLLAAKGLLHGNEIISIQETVVDLVMFGLSFVSDAFAVYYRLKATTAGALANPELVRQTAIEVISNHAEEAKKISDELAELMKQHDAINEKIIALGKANNVGTK